MIHYRLYFYNGLITIVCVQDFDIPDYNESLFVKNSAGEPHQFKNEHEAVEKLNEWYTPSQIDPEHRTQFDFLTRG